MTTEKKDILETSLHFSTPIYRIEKPEWLNSAIKVTDKYIKDAYKEKEPLLEQREKFLGKENYKKVKDHGLSYHSGHLNGEPELKELENYIGATTRNLLDEWGYDMSQYTVFFTEFWVQEFSKNGGGHQDAHLHWDNHMSGFYFLKCSDKTSFPEFYDPRGGAQMTKLAQKNIENATYMSERIYFKPKPGTLMFFPAYLEHQFKVDDGIDDFRFIHFNLQAVRNGILNTARQMSNE